MRVVTGAGDAYEVMVGTGVGRYSVLIGDAANDPAGGVPMIEAPSDLIEAPIDPKETGAERV
jgi:hypothetical protein